MTSRKQKLVMEVNLLSEQRYLYNKFLKEDDVAEIPKLQVVSIKGKPGKYKVSLYSKLDNGNMKDIMNNDILEKLNLKIEYANQESATLDVNKVTPDQLKNI
jgi:hypothetical protein